MTSSIGRPPITAIGLGSGAGGSAADWRSCAVRGAPFRPAASRTAEEVAENRTEARVRADQAKAERRRLSEDVPRARHAYIDDLSRQRLAKRPEARAAAQARRSYADAVAQVIGAMNPGPQREAAKVSYSVREQSLVRIAGSASAVPGRRTRDEPTVQYHVLFDFLRERDIDLYETAACISPRSEIRRLSNSVALLAGRLRPPSRQQLKRTTLVPVDKSLQHSEGASTRHRQVFRRKMRLERQIREPI